MFVYSFVATINCSVPLQSVWKVRNLWDLSLYLLFRTYALHVHLLPSKYFSQLLYHDFLFRSTCSHWFLIFWTPCILRPILLLNIIGKHVYFYCCLSECNENIKTWMVNIFLHLNETKSDLILFGPSKSTTILLNSLNS